MSFLYRNYDKEIVSKINLKSDEFISVLQSCIVALLISTSSGEEVRIKEVHDMIVKSKNNMKLGEIEKNIEEKVRLMSGMCFKPYQSDNYLPQVNLVVYNRNDNTEAFNLM